MSELAGRKVLVVGAGTQASDDPDAPRGNGRAIAVVAGRAGATVACADLDTDAARATVDLVEAEGTTAHVFTADVRTRMRALAPSTRPLHRIAGFIPAAGLEVCRRPSPARRIVDARVGRQRDMAPVG